MGFHSNVFQPYGYIYLATPNTSARPIDHEPSAFTYGRAAGGVSFILLVTDKVCNSVATNNHKLVLGARDGEIEGRLEPRIGGVIIILHTLFIAVTGYIHQGVNLAMEGNVCNLEVYSDEWF